MLERLQLQQSSDGSCYDITLMIRIREYLAKTRDEISLSVVTTK